MHLTLTGGESRLALSRQDGSIAGLTYRDRELLLPAKGAFSLRFLDEAGDYLEADSTEFTRFELAEAAGKVLCRYGEHAGYPGLSVEISIRVEGEFFRFRPAVRGIPAGLTLELIEAPRPVMPREFELFWPYSEGCLVREPEKSNRTFQRFHFPGTGGVGYYPGICQMQFMAAYRPDGAGGVYFAADDFAHTTKALEFGGDGDGRVRLRIECGCGDGAGEPDFTLPFDLLLGGFSGDWMDACALYRDWVKEDPAMERSFPMPEWLEDSPVIITYPVRGTGTISEEANNMLPYERPFPRLMELAEAFEARIMALLMRWDHNGPWQPPYYWPPYGGEESFYRLRDLLHDAGHLLGVYGSGTAFTRRSKVGAYSAEEEFEKQGLLRHMGRGPKGESRAHICEALRDGCELCIRDEWSREVLRSETRKIAAAGVDYFQLFDQNLGAASFLCYSREHGHPHAPGAWQTRAMRQLLDDLNSDIRASGSEMILGTECAAAGPYTAGLPFNDLRDNFPTRWAVPVPGHQFVFHQWSENFLGNQCEAWARYRCPESPDNLQFRLARGFINGELLTVTLRGSGEIDWGAASDWAEPAPKQEPLLHLIRNLNRMRKTYADHLRRGEMAKPFCRVEAGVYTFCAASFDMEFPTVLDSSWLAADGTKMQFLVNFREKPERVRLYPAPGVAVRPIGGVAFCSEPFELAIPPLEAVALEIR